MCRSPIVISALTALFFLNVVQSIAQWVWTNQILVSTELLNDANYISGDAGPHWMNLMSVINAFLLATIADSLLVRSSFHSVYFSNYVGRYGGAIMYGIAHSA